MNLLIRSVRRKAERRRATFTIVEIWQFDGLTERPLIKTRQVLAVAEVVRLLDEAAKTEVSHVWGQSLNSE